MNKRLEMLEGLTRSGQADSFAWYALALEYRKANSLSHAVEAFTTLRAKDPDYLPMYLMAGQILTELNELERAREWLTAGTALARKKGDHKALSELESALALAG